MTIDGEEEEDILHFGGFKKSWKQSAMEQEPQELVGHEQESQEVLGDNAEEPRLGKVPEEVPGRAPSRKITSFVDRSGRASCPTSLRHMTGAVRSPGG